MGITLEPDYLSEQLNMIPECSVTQSNKLCYLLEDAANIIAVNNKLLYYQVNLNICLHIICVLPCLF